MDQLDAKRGNTPLFSGLAVVSEGLARERHVTFVPVFVVSVITWLRAQRAYYGSIARLALAGASRHDGAEPAAAART